MRVLIGALGSHGDVLPFLGIGRALQHRGHDVRLYGNGLFAAPAAAAGLRYVETSEAGLLRAALDDPDATRSRAGLRLIAQGTIASVRPDLQAMAADVLPGRTLLVGSTLAFAPRLLAESRGLPFAGVHLSPSLFRSDHAAPRMAGVGRFERWPSTIRRAVLALADRWVLDPAFAVPLDDIRAELGLAPVRRLFQHWLHGASVEIGLFPPWFASPQPGWPANLVLTGFPLFDDPGAGALAAPLERFLATGPAPVMFTAGTANTTSRDFYAESMHACARLGLRGLLVAGKRSQLPSHLPSELLHVDYAPFSRLLPRTAGVVHHGGIGTASQALAAGVPQLIRPMAYDQFDNSARVCRLGVGIELLPRAYHGKRLDMALGELLSHPSLRRACAAVATRLARTKAEDEPIEATCRLLESALAQSLPPAPPAR